MSGYGDKTGQTEEYGNPVQQTGGKYETGVTQSTGGKHGTGIGEYDEQGGKKKESVVDKIKDILPGGNKEQIPKADQDVYGQGHGATTIPREEDVTYGVDGQPEKKSFIEKIKEKLPGGHN